MIKMDPTTMIPPIIQLFWSYTSLFIFCEFGERETNEFAKLNDSIYHIKWYSCPLKIKRNLPFIIKNTQQMVILQSYGQFFCTREAFKNVSNEDIIVYTF